MLKKLGAAGIAVLCLVAMPILALAQAGADTTTTVHVGSTLNDLLIAYVGVIGTIVTAIVGWLGYKFFGIRMDAASRETLNSLATNLAGKFLVNKETIVGLNIDIGNPEIARLANGGLDRARDALERFGLGPDALKERIVEKIGVMTAASTATAAVEAAPPKT